MDKELKKLQEEMIEEAKKVRKDYMNNPSDMSGSRVHVHENSPFLATKKERLIKFDGKEMKIKPDSK